MVPALPADQHAHVAGATNGILWNHALGFDSFTLEERRDRLGQDTLGLEQEGDFYSAGSTSTSHRLLLRSISVLTGLLIDRFVYA